MAIMRWDPFGEVMRMQRDMESIFGRMGMQGEGSKGVSAVAWMPKIDVEQKGDDIVVHAELAGVKPEDVDIEVTDGVLTIKGERKSEEKREGEGWLVRESSYGSFERSMVLPEGVEPGSIKAEFQDGMLLLHIPKAMEAAKPKTTKISVGAAGAAGQMGSGQSEAPRAEMPATATPAGQMGAGQMGAGAPGGEQKPEGESAPEGAVAAQAGQAGGME